MVLSISRHSRSTLLGKFYRWESLSLIEIIHLYLKVSQINEIFRIELNSPEMTNPSGVDIQ